MSKLQQKLPIVTAMRTVKYSAVHPVSLALAMGRPYRASFPR